MLKKNKLSDDRCKLSGEYIPTIKHKPMKSLGKGFDHTLKDAVAFQETRDSVERWLNKIDRSDLSGRFKTWIYQHFVLPKILWSLAIYEFTSCNVEQLEKRFNSRLRRWLGLPKYLCCAAVYSNSNILHLPFKSLVEEYKVAKVRTTIQFMFSKDPKIFGAESKSIQERNGKRQRN